MTSGSNSVVVGMSREEWVATVRGGRLRGTGGRWWGVGVREFRESREIVVGGVHRRRSPFGVSEGTYSRGPRYKGSLTSVTSQSCLYSGREGGYTVIFVHRLTSRL